MPVRHPAALRPAPVSRRPWRRWAGACLATALGLAGPLPGLAATAAPPPTVASKTEGIVVRVSDGDTFWLRSGPGRRPLRVRLQGIDAPELCQNGGPEARKALETLVLGRRIQVRVWSADRYGRRLVQARLGGKDVAEQLVRQGWAWSDDYRGRPGPYAAAAKAARAEGLGLFAQADAVAPQVFRQEHGACLATLMPPAADTSAAPRPDIRR